MIPAWAIALAVLSANVSGVGLYLAWVSQGISRDAVWNRTHTETD